MLKSMSKRMYNNLLRYLIKARISAPDLFNRTSYRSYSGGGRNKAKSHAWLIFCSRF